MLEKVKDKEKEVKFDGNFYIQGYRDNLIIFEGEKDIVLEIQE